MYNKEYDLIVVGAGHAGIEASRAASKMGISVLLITYDLNKIGMMSCNPALGGMAKSHVIKEIDALGGLMARAGDMSSMQYRILNRRKGAAVRATRTQNDRAMYVDSITKLLKEFSNIEFLADEVIDIIIEDKKVQGIVTLKEGSIFARNIIITSGTFLDGRIHKGKDNVSAGRYGDPASLILSEKIKSLNIKTYRFKTGTPARIVQDSVDFSRMTKQDGDNDYLPLSFFSDKDPDFEHTPCWSTSTTKETHDLIRANLKYSAMYGGNIDATGARYCPSVEDKIVRFAHHESHTLMLEPEGYGNPLMYLNGFSNSLPVDIQEQLLKTIPGLEDAKIAEYAYAIEYDVIDSTQLRQSMEYFEIEGLFFAGQVNGTSGYEEAAGQGLVAGINAASKILGTNQFILRPEESYIGVMCSDITMRGVDEPYRLFTSRAEFRLILREENAYRRLFNYADYYGLYTDDDRYKIKKKIDDFENTVVFLKKKNVPKEIDIKRTDTKIWDYLRMPGNKLSNFSELLTDNYIEVDEMMNYWIEVEAKYSGYIAKEKERIDRLERMMSNTIPENIDYDAIGALTQETKEKLRKYRPSNIREASEIKGISVAHIMALASYIKKL